MCTFKKDAHKMHVLFKIAFYIHSVVKTNRWDLCLANAIIKRENAGLLKSFYSLHYLNDYSSYHFR